MHVRGIPPELSQQMEALNLSIVGRGFLAALEAKPTLLDQIREAQKNDPDTLAHITKGHELCKYQNGNEMKLGWISSPDFRKPKVDMILYG